MDPHSTRSQYNQRTPKSSPYTSMAKPNLDYLPKRSKSVSKQSSVPASGKANSGPVELFSPRPIATNSRVKRNEQYKKDIYLAFINNALQEKICGNTEPFDELVNQFCLKRGDTPPSAQLRLWLLALSHVVSRLERPHAALVEAIVSMPWTTLDSSVVRSYTVFIGMLVSARPEYLTLVLDKIAQGFTHQYGLQALDANQAEGSSSPLTRRTIYDRLHYLLQHLLTLIPTLPNTLQPLLARHFPHKRQNLVTQITYIRNLLRIMEYCSEVSDRILATIVDRAIQIDVEIQVELEELEDEAFEDHVGVFELDPFDTIVGQDGSDSESDDDDDNGDEDFSDLSSEAEDAEDNPKHVLANESLDIRHIQDMVNKLDSILKLMFDYFNRMYSMPELSSDGSFLPPFPEPLSPPPTLPMNYSNPLELTPPRSVPSAEHIKNIQRSQFHCLLAIFDRTIIRTFKSRYTQFLLFWFASLDQEFSDLFQGMLVQKALLDKAQPVVTRSAAASYIASFVSRAQFIDREATRRVVSVLCEFLRNYLNSYERDGDFPSETVHLNVFYAIVQAVFLIFCFRWRDLLEELETVEADELSGVSGPGKKWMPPLNIIQRVVTSPLNPLKICSENVVMQFALVSQATDFVYCYSILESNRRSEYTSDTANKSQQQRVQQLALRTSFNAELHSFFPFDPFKLPKSNSYIQSVYREWSSVAINDGEDDEDEENPESPRSVRPTLEVPAGYRPRGSIEDDTGGLGVSFEGMNISPARAADSTRSIS